MVNTTNAVNGTLIGPSLRTAFGETLVGFQTPLLQLSFPYNINTDLVTSTTAGSGTVTQSSSFAVLSTGAAINSTAQLTSKRVIHYRPGQGVSAYFTAIFSAGVAGNTQIIGIGDSVNGFFFGYNGTSFGILHRNNSGDSWIAKSSWNSDPMDGTGPTKVVLDPTKGNVYKIQFQWLGFGAINFFIENPNTGAFYLVHQIQYPNANTSVSLTNPSLPMYAQVDNDTNNTDIVLKTPSWCVQLEGVSILSSTRNAQSNRKTGITTETSVITIRNKTTFAGVTNKSTVLPDFISLNVAGNNDCRFTVYYNGTIGGSPSYNDISTNTSVVDFDIAGTTVSGRELFYVMVNSGSQETVDISNLNIFLEPGDTLTISAQSSAGGGAAIACDVGISWTERI